MPGEKMDTQLTIKKTQKNRFTPTLPDSIRHGGIPFVREITAAETASVPATEYSLNQRY